MLYVPPKNKYLLEYLLLKLHYGRRQLLPEFTDWQPQRDCPGFLLQPSKQLRPYASSAPILFGQEVAELESEAAQGEERAEIADTSISRCQRV